MDEHRVLLNRARAAVALGGALCLLAVAAVVVPRHLGSIGNVYVYDRYWGQGYLRTGFHGTGWLLLSSVLLFVGAPVMAAGFHAYRSTSHPAGLPVARTTKAPRP